MQLITFSVAIFTGTLLAFIDKKTVNTKLVTKRLDDNKEGIELSRALEHLELCNGVNDEN